MAEMAQEEIAGAEAELLQPGIVTKCQDDCSEKAAKDAATRKGLIGSEDCIYNFP